MQASNDIENLTKREIKIRIAVDSLLTHFGFLSDMLTFFYVLKIKLYSTPLLYVWYNSRIKCLTK